jgi:glutaminyl-peptide cyclotransferase
MNTERIGIIAIAMVALVVSAVSILQYYRPVTQPQAARPPAPAVAKAETSAVENVQGYEVVREYPHDTGAFTQGLIYLDGFFYESTGLTGRSSLRKVRLETGEVIQQLDVNPRDFAEGLTDWRGRLLQLTPRRRGSAPIWHLDIFFEDAMRHFRGYNTGVTYDLASLKPQAMFRYQGEAWGLTHDDRRLILSDGSSRLRFLDPEKFTELGHVDVFDGERPVALLNELEFVDGKIYANVFHQDRIAIIDPDSGKVTGWIDLAGLKSRMPPLPEEPNPGSTSSPGPILNGVAYDAAGRRLFVTGKYWPKLFEIRLK